MFKTVVPHEAILAALLHDWCKIFCYQSTTRNVKNDETGQWEKVPWYKWKASPMPLGHGTSSIYSAQKYFKLTKEQLLAIRWHMGKWYTAQNEDGDLSESNANFPMVLLLQWADQTSITVWGKDA